MDYWININGQQSGPYSYEQIQQSLAEGRISYNDYIWTAETNAWVTIQEKPEFAIPPVNLPSPSLPKQGAKSAGKKMGAVEIFGRCFAAFVVLFFVGGFWSIKSGWLKEGLTLLGNSEKNAQANKNYKKKLAIQKEERLAQVEEANRRKEEEAKRAEEEEEVRRQEEEVRRQEEEVKRNALRLLAEAQRKREATLKYFDKKFKLLEFEIENSFQKKILNSNFFNSSELDDFAPSYVLALRSAPNLLLAAIRAYVDYKGEKDEELKKKKVDRFNLRLEEAVQNFKNEKIQNEVLAAFSAITNRKHIWYKIIYNGGVDIYEFRKLTEEEKDVASGLSEIVSSLKAFENNPKSLSIFDSFLGGRPITNTLIEFSAFVDEGKFPDQIENTIK
jgi:hypothetical protein